MLGESEATVRDQMAANVVLYAQVDCYGNVRIKNTLNGVTYLLPPEEGIAPADVLAVELGNKIGVYNNNGGEKPDGGAAAKSVQIPTGNPEQAGASIAQQPPSLPRPQRVTFGITAWGSG